jgi:hypothetical protein
MADPELYKDGVKQHQTTTRHDTATRIVASLMQEWESLQASIDQLSRED